MTLRRLVTIGEIDAEATECGMCKHLWLGPYPTQYCSWLDATIENDKRLPECLAAEAKGKPDIRIGPPLEFNAHGAFDHLAEHDDDAEEKP